MSKINEFRIRGTLPSLCYLRVDSGRRRLPSMTLSSRRDLVVGLKQFLNKINEYRIGAGTKELKFELEEMKSIRKSFEINQ